MNHRTHGEHPVRLRKIIYLLGSIVLLASLTLGACTTAPTETAELPPAVEETEAAQPEATEAPPEPTERKVATFIYTQEFDNLSPLYTDMWFAWTTWQLFNHWAWEFDEKNEPFPKLVTEIPSVDNGGLSADGKTITMKLRDDITWSDGTPVTSDDFVFTYEMAVSTNNSVTSAYPYDKVESMEAPDAQTVVINFTDPFAPWLATMWHGILPAHILRPIYEAEGTLDNAEWLRAPMVGLGPYSFVEWESGSFARFVRNENYWGEKPVIDEIFIRFVPDDTSQTNAMVAGDAHLGTFIPYNDVPKLEDAGLTITTEPSGYNEWLFFLVNEELGHPALLDANVRRAIAIAIDRQAITADLLLGLTKVPESYWDAMPFYNDPPLEPYPYDPEAAKQLLDEAGWVDSNGDGVREKDGVDLAISYGTNIREVRQETQAVIQQQLADIGIKVELFSYEDDIYFANFGEGPAASGDLDIMEWSDGPVWPDADIYYWLCSEIPTKEYPAGTNWFFLCDEELDALILQQATQVNADERQVTISKINQLFHDKVYIIGLWQDPDVYAVSPDLLNVKFSGVTPFFNIVEWDLK
jgi:peptide/nickel transport system substrate-binding protein